MRGLLLGLLVACGGAAGTPGLPPVSRPTATKPPRMIREPIDAITSLDQPLREAAWMIPGPARLELGGTSLEPADDHVYEVSVIEEQGSDVRVGVRLDHARFAIWTPRAQLLAVMARDHRIAEPTGGAEAVLRAHAAVRRLARKEGRTQIRYSGFVEIEVWVADDHLVERGPAGRTRGVWFASTRRRLLVTPGAVIRAEPRWTARQLAVVNDGAFLDIVRELDDAWVEVQHEDNEVRVHGFVSKRDPPARTHGRRRVEPKASQVIANVRVPDRTCLHAGGEPVGFVVGEQPALLESAARTGWFTVTLDTPWGPLPFEVKGPSEANLATCGAP